MNRVFSVPSLIVLVLVIVLLSPDASFAVPRDQVVRIMCSDLMHENSTLDMPNFFGSMENISSEMRTSGFGTARTGSGPNVNFGLAQCYGDLSLLDCVLCYAAARNVIPQCYAEAHTGGRVYLDGCFMRTENYRFFEDYTGSNDTTICGNTTQRDLAFQESTRQALSQAVTSAPSSNGYARAQVAVSGTSYMSAYVLANCWRTLNASSCRHCLETASASLSSCLPWNEGRALNTGCFMRYSDTDFLNPVLRNGRSRVTVILVIVVSTVVFIIGVIIGVYIRKRRIIHMKRRGNAHKFVKTLNDSSLNFKYSTLEKATDSFDEANTLGSGGFGTVYKGVLPDGREIAVKRLFVNNKHRAADFYNEVNIISGVEHKNLVRLLGCSCSGPESLLVYEFLPNKSLDCFIFDPSKANSLSWERRFDIIIGTAEGLVYLHENTTTRIIHRDIKASNILLDLRLRAKIADFGLARSFEEDKSHISTAIAGTLGYMAPEYFAHGKLTEKVDVYSFGVLLLEIVSGRQNNRSEAVLYTDSLLTIAWKHFQERTLDELIDPYLMLHSHQSTNTKTEIIRVVHVGLLCCQKIPSLRPSMSMALQLLVNNDERLPSPTCPPFLDENTMDLNGVICESSSTPLQCGNVESVASMSDSIFYPR